MFYGLYGSWWVYAALVALLVVLYLPDRPRRPAFRPISHPGAKRPTERTEAQKEMLPRLKSS